MGFTSKRLRLYQSKNFIEGEETEKGLVTATAAVTMTGTRRRQDRGKRSVFIETEKKSQQNRQTATAENVGAENAVFRAEYKQRNKYPKGYVVTLSATIHIDLLCFAAGVCKLSFKTCGFIFLIHNIP